ncbi:MAG: hypothetical protein MUO99_07880 [Dehalococcoidales bacterium]|nr:hypothetical protein [Dehalococcoidales bacterium]
MINNHLDGVTPRLIGWHEVEITYIPDTLLDALWLLFMLEVQGKVKVARCTYCGDWFEFERSTKSFCTDKHRLYFHRRNKRQGGAR